jgi:hypothetical protein
MDPITSHLDHSGRKSRRTRIDQQIANSTMRVPGAMREVSRGVFGDGAISKTKPGT